MLWGGLKPIRRRFILDVLTLALLTYTIRIPFIDRSTKRTHKQLLLLAGAITLSTAGFTKRWTVSFPMIPIIFLQCYRYNLTAASTNSWPAIIIEYTSLLLVAKSLFLTILFPAVKINDIEGKYNVGIIDLQLPVSKIGNISSLKHDHVTVKLLYPTLEKSERVPYFDPDISQRICKALMEVGAPPPLNKLGFMLDQWRLSTVWGKINAVPHVPEADDDDDDDNDDDDDGGGGNKKVKDKVQLPVAIYSHGLTGNAEVYSYQTMNLAANGTFVMSITHSDASAIGVKKRDSFIEYDPRIANLSKKQDTFVQSVTERRKQVEYRSKDILAAVDALTAYALKGREIPELEKTGVSFVDMLDFENMFVIGHSFGGATAINASNMKPELFTCCIAHDPAVDWLPDECRRTLFSKDRFIGSDLTYKGGTRGLPDTNADVIKVPNIHNLDLYFLYSHEWASKNWGHYAYIRDLFKRGQLGRKNGPSDVTFVYHANHSEFSDSCMKLPLWLARAVGVTGKRNPHETAAEIFDRTSVFLKEVKDKQLFLKNKKD